MSRDQAARSMREAGLSAVVRGRRSRTAATATAGADQCSGLDERNLAAAAPGRLWVAEISYVRTSWMFVCTAFVIDVCSRRIVGWATRSSMTAE